MRKVGLMRGQFALLMGFVLFQLFLLNESIDTQRTVPKNVSPPVQLLTLNDHVVVNNGLANITFSTPGGMVTGISYNGIDNIFEPRNEESNRGYWDIVWTNNDNSRDSFDKLKGTQFSVITEDEDQVELSFTKLWNSSSSDSPPLNIDKRFVVLRGVPGFYSYAIYERLQGWPGMNIYQSRIAFKLQQRLFQYMAVSDQRQRIMPSPEDRAMGHPLAYPEAVLVSSTGEVDDKYQYSIENKDNKVHGWICSNPPTGFWVITPSNEFRTGGPVKQDLTSHVGPTSLSMFFSTHYAGISLGLKFQDGEPWKKVFGPVLIYLNSISGGQGSSLQLWPDAKQQMFKEARSWPYNFPKSNDYPRANERGTVTGTLLVRDRYNSPELINAVSAYVGLAPPGDVGSWQTENKGYQFWTKTDAEGRFLIKNVRAGNYNLYAWVPGFIGDYKYEPPIIINPGGTIELGNLEYLPPRNGATIWEIGIPDRTAAEFFVPGPNPILVNQLFVRKTSQRFRQYGLWDRYSDIYPNEDLIFNIGVDNCHDNWFFAHVNRKMGNGYVPTTWKIVFPLEKVDTVRNYTLQMALASVNEAELQVRINDPSARVPHFTTGLIGKDNAIARHGIHGLYRLYSINVSGSLLQIGSNTIFLTQSRGGSPFRGIMYDYIRLEQPQDAN